MKLRIGTRGSELALAQTALVANALKSHGHTTETVIISTVGDRVTDRAFTEVGALGVFVREIEVALLEGRVDVAVHSYKDLPSHSHDNLVVAAVPERVDAADILLARREVMDDLRGGPLPLRAGTRVGTSSARRKALLCSLRPDLDVGPLRGNVPTRLGSITAGLFDAVVLAAAGVDRLERTRRAVPLVPPGIVRTRLDPAVFVPAPAQGAIAVQTRADATAIRVAVAAIDDARTARTLDVERRALALADGGCRTPFGAWCQVTDTGSLRLVAARSRADGTVVWSDVNGTDPESLVAASWRELTTLVIAL